MKLEEYVKEAKEILDNFEKEYKETHKNYPEDWPLEMEETLWMSQELNYRF